MDENGWKEWKRHVLSEIDRFSEHSCYVKGRLEQIKDSIAILREDIAALKVKSGIWGLVGGLIPAVILIVGLFFKKIF